MSTVRETYKVSATLVNSYFNMKNSKYKDSADNFLKTLNRVPLKKTYSLNRGNAFEIAVARNKNEPFYNIVKDCKKQVFISKKIPMTDEDFDVEIVGNIDFITEDKSIIYDTKRVNRWNVEKYDDSVQHLFYYYAVPESKNFYYLVGAGPKWVATEYYQVGYGKDSPDELERKCVDIVREFIKYIKDSNLMDVYKKNYLASDKDKKGERK